MRLRDEWGPDWKDLRSWMFSLGLWRVTKSFKKGVMWHIRVGFRALTAFKVWKVDLGTQDRKSSEEASRGMLKPKLWLEPSLTKPLPAHKSFQGLAL